jgi:iron(III) transport system permease protein
VAFVALLAALVLAPIAALVQIALNGSTENWSHLGSYVLLPALANTAALLLGVGTIVIVAGVGVAWLMTTFSFPGRDAIAWLLPLPLALPTYIVAYIYVDLLDALGPVHRLLTALGWPNFFDVRSLGGAVFVMSVVLYPYVYLAARATLQAQGATAIEMARTHGATKWQIARDITLPMAWPAIVAGLTLALLESLNDIGASEYLGVQTLTLSIFTTWLNRGSLNDAAQIACVMLVAIAVILALERIGRRDAGQVSIDPRWREITRLRLTGRMAWLATAACLVPVTFGFLLPVGFLAREVVVRGLLVGFDMGLVRHATTTVEFATVATILVLIFGFGAGVAARVARSAFSGACVALARLGYAVPGTVLALGLLTPLVAIDEGINAIARSAINTTFGLFIVASGAAVVIAYVVRFLAIAICFTQAGLARISTDLDDAARTAGAGPFAVMRLVHLPLTRPALWAAALLVFVDCLKELPATLLLRPLNVETLSTYIYQFATRGSFEQGSLAALIIVAVGILPVIRITRYADMATMVGRGEN